MASFFCAPIRSRSPICVSVCVLQILLFVQSRSISLGRPRQQLVRTQKAPPQKANASAGSSCGISFSSTARYVTLANNKYQSIFFLLIFSLECPFPEAPEAVWFVSLLQFYVQRHQAVFAFRQKPNHISYFHSCCEIALRSNSFTKIRTFTTSN